VTEPEKAEAATSDREEVAPTDLEQVTPIDLGEAAWEPEPLFPLKPEDTAPAPAPEVEAPGAEVDLAGPGLEAPAPVPQARAAEDEPTAVPEPAVAARSGLVLPVVAGLTVLLLLLTGLLAFRITDRRDPDELVVLAVLARPDKSILVEQSRKDAVAAGRDAARLVFSYDYRRLDKDFKAALATTTGTFRKDYETTTKKLVGDVAPRYKAVLVAEVSEAGVITASEDRVLLLVFLNVQSQSSLTTAPKITPRRLKMTMQREGERWLVADVDTL
jgi:hypothetical protein